MNNPNEVANTQHLPSPELGPNGIGSVGDDKPETEDVITPEPAPDAASSPRRSKYPPIFTLLTSRRLVTALWGCIVQGSLMTAFDSVVPLFVQRVFHWNSVGAGLVFLALIVPSFAAPLIGWISDKYGPRKHVLRLFLSYFGLCPEFSSSAPQDSHHIQIRQR